jgi:uncharacterized membrane protein YfcA
MPIDVSYILIGLGIGFLVGATSIGGGSLMTPILVFMGLSPATAVGTDLVYSAVTRSLGGYLHWRQGTVNFEAVKKLAVGSLPSALVVTILVTYFLTSAKSWTQGFITDSLACVLLFVAVCLVFKPWLEGRFDNVTVKQQTFFAAGVGALVGALVALTSVGAGSLTFIVLVVLLRGAASSELVGTDIFHAALLSIVAATVKSISTIFVAHSVDYSVVGLLLIGSLPGLFVGSKLTVSIPDVVMRFGIALTLAFVSLRLLSVF